MYKLTKPIFEGADFGCVQRLSDNAFIPFAPDNTDYQTFKKDINEGAELLDAEGNVMTDAQAFVKELP